MYVKRADTIEVTNDGDRAYVNEAMDSLDAWLNGSGPQSSSPEFIFSKSNSYLRLVLMQVGNLL